MKDFRLLRFRAARVPAVGALLIAASMGAHAQYDPGASAMLGAGYGFNALSQSTMNNAFRASRVDEAGKGGKSNKVSAPQSPAGSAKRANAAGGSSPAAIKLKPQYTMADVERYMQQRQAFHMKALAPEYHRRARADGEASAQRWIEARSRAIGLEEGAKARALFAQN